VTAAVGKVPAAGGGVYEIVGVKPLGRQRRGPFEESGSRAAHVVALTAVDYGQIAVETYDTRTHREGRIHK